jgi:hypothetical protein
MDDLISDCITSGVKLAGLQHRLLYGTREVAIAAMSYATIARLRMKRDSGDGLSCSSDEVFERNGAKDLACFSFMIIDNQFHLG